jgi:hypothetical protein
MGRACLVGFLMVIKRGKKSKRAGYLHHDAKPKNMALQKKFLVNCCSEASSFCPSA